VKETGVDGTGGDRCSFLDESQTTQNELLFIGSKISEVILIVLKLISNSSSLKLLLMNVLSAGLKLESLLIS
jgi:hypothetical protein